MPAVAIVETVAALACIMIVMEDYDYDCGGDVGLSFIHLQQLLYPTQGCGGSRADPSNARKHTT